MPVIAFDFQAKLERQIDVAEVPTALSTGRFLWFDADVDADPVAAKAALSALGVNGQAAAEAIGPDLDGRHDLYDDVLHVAFTGAVYRDSAVDGPSMACPHVDLLVGENFLVALHKGPAEFIDGVRRTYRRDFQRFAQSGGFLLYEYWDQLIESYRRTFRALDARSSAVQAGIITAVDDAIFARASAVQRDMLRLRKHMLAAREVLHELTTRRTPFVRESSLPSLERLAGALERLVGDLTVERESLAETLNLYMGIVAHRTNQIVTRLTVISTVFLPLTFLVGVYGMNFGDIPETKLDHGYPLFWAACLLIAGGLLFWMKRRRWW